MAAGVGVRQKMCRRLRAWRSAAEFLVAKISALY
jgi:hypothetical protein